MREWCRALCILITLASAAPAGAQDTYRFEWRVIGTVTRWSDGSDQESTTRAAINDTATLVLANDPSADVRFAFDFTGPQGTGSGFVPRAADETLDPNFAFPDPLPTSRPPAEERSLRGTFRRSADEAAPSAFEVVYSETFVCCSTPTACGNVKRWEVLFIGNAWRSPGTPR